MRSKPNMRAQGEQVKAGWKRSWDRAASSRLQGHVVCAGGQQAARLARAASKVLPTFGPAELPHGWHSQPNPACAPPRLPDVGCHRLNVIGQRFQVVGQGGDGGVDALHQVGGLWQVGSKIYVPKSG